MVWITETEAADYRDLLTQARDLRLPGIDCRVDQAEIRARATGLLSRLEACEPVSGMVEVPDDLPGEVVAVVEWLGRLAAGRCSGRVEDPTETSWLPAIGLTLILGGLGVAAWSLAR